MLGRPVVFEVLAQWDEEAKAGSVRGDRLNPIVIMMMVFFFTVPPPVCGSRDAICAAAALTAGEPCGWRFSAPAPCWCRGCWGHTTNRELER